MKTVELGNFQQESIPSFQNIEGKEVTFPEYLKSHGLYASRAHLYLMTTGIEVGDECTRESQLQTENGNVLTNDVMLGKGGDAISISSCSTSVESCSKNEVLAPSSPPRGEAGVCTPEWLDSQHILVHYESPSESSYSDEAITICSFSREQCLEIASVNDHTLLGTPLPEFQPPESGFTVSSIEKGSNLYLTKVVQDIDDTYQDPNGHQASQIQSTYEFPMADREQDSLILHHPTEVWGYDNKELVIAVIASHPNSALYTWYRNGAVFKEGFNFCCLAVNQEGDYSVKVQCGGQEAVSQVVQIVRFAISPTVSAGGSNAQGKTAGDNEKEAPPPPSDSASLGIPFIERSDLKYDPKVDEIGRGTFGAVYKASWAGTAVAVKQMKVRNVKLMQSVLQSEVRVHSKIRHPNIVQIMAVALGKSAVYIVCELVNGANLDELLFWNDEEATSSTFTIPDDKKPYVGRQIVQAVAYLHNLKPPILHRDIKPANVLVATGSYVTKLCDMGLGKIKSAQTTARVTTAGIAGTPNYMAPECLLQKRKATTKADVWSLACTLVELFTGKDCWGQTEDLVPKSHKNSDEDAPQGCEGIFRCLKAGELPSALQLIAPEHVLKNVLVNCFSYNESERPDAIEILGHF